MTWTRTAPAIPGWYWWRESVSRSPIIRRVDNWPSGGLVVHTRWDGATTPETIEGEWCGPLQEPGGDVVEN